MQNKEVNIKTLKNYLLGNLPPPDLQAIDLQIISDEISEENLLWAESELMEDYLDKSLSLSEINLFKENFLISPERIAQLKQISLIGNYARQSVSKGVSEDVCEKPPKSFFQKLKIFFSLNLRPLAAVSALIIVGLFAVYYFNADRQTASESEFAALNRNDLSDLAQLKPLTSLNLATGVFRDSTSGLNKLPENKLTEKVLFRLALPAPSNAPDKYKAELVKEGKTTFTLNKLPFYNNPNGQELRLLLPSNELKKGTYRIKLTKESAPESTYIYNFIVE